MRIRDRSRAGPLKFYDFVNFSGIKIPGLRKNQEMERTSLRFAAHLLVIYLAGAGADGWCIPLR